MTKSLFHTAFNSGSRSPQATAHLLLKVADKLLQEPSAQRRAVEASRLLLCSRRERDWKKPDSRQDPGNKLFLVAVARSECVQEHTADLIALCRRFGLHFDKPKVSEKAKPSCAWYFKCPFGAVLRHERP